MLRSTCIAFLACIASSVSSAATPRTEAAAIDPPSFKVFILAGQSNMEGQAVVDLSGKDYNEGRGTLEAIARDPRTGAAVAHLRAEDGSWKTRDDVFVRYQPMDHPARTGPLGFGFTPYLDAHHFGPELQFGHILGDAIGEPVLLVKTAWGGKSLYADFRPPSSGGETGPFYRRMIDDVRAAIARAGDEFPALKGATPRLAGFVWYHGWNDGCDPKNAVPEYEENLVNLVRDVRREFDAPCLPVVIGEITGPWVDAPGEWDTLRKAQAKAAAREELRCADGSSHVLFVPTAAFVRAPEDSPNPGHGHHEFGNAETYFLVGDALGKAMRALVVDGAPAFEPTLPAPPAEKGEMSGYMLVPVDRVPEEFNAGFSLYSAAWPLLDRYPGPNFQTGLFGTWMFAQFARGADGKHDPNDKPKDMYSDIEGGLGWWRDTRFATTTPKFIMGGVAPDFAAWANGPGAGKGRDWSTPLGKYAIAQLSPWVVWPPDGLNLAQGTCGELFGYGYLPLPLIDAKATTLGKESPTGGQSWTLFLNTTNFKGPLCFFTPHFWAEHALARPELVGKLLDTRPSDPNKAFQMETQWIPAALSAATGDGSTYARVAPTSFPVDAQGRTVVLHRLTCYTRAALPDAVRAWFDGGTAPSGALDPAASFVQEFRKGGGSTWRIFAEGTDKEEKRDVDWRRFGTPAAHDAATYGFTWNPEFVQPVNDGRGARVRLPEYFKLAKEGEGKSRWMAVQASEVPADARLADANFAPPRAPRPEPYVTPEEPDSPFRKPGPVAGPFETTLGDGSTVTYYWYRFADQPAMVMAGLSDAERDEAQRRVELMHRAWTKEREYLAPPTTGSLASLDPALLVTPPKGLEIGHVPIAVKQERKNARGR
ncbi:MAG: sialate O-acetylesterase [Phycisphaerales bacterium]